MLTNSHSPAHGALIKVLACQTPTDRRERQLWLAVIGQAAFDGFVSCAIGRGEREAQAAARDWFLTPDFERVCAYAGLDADWVRDCVSAFARHVMCRDVALAHYANVLRRLDSRRTAHLLGQRHTKLRRPIESAPLMIP